MSHGIKSKILKWLKQSIQDARALGELHACRYLGNMDSKVNNASCSDKLEDPPKIPELKGTIHMSDKLILWSDQSGFICTLGLNKSHQFCAWS
jgi:hypothetical protein